MTYDDDMLHEGSPTAITTWLRIRFDPLNPDMQLIEVEDIAHALARQCRYNGHVGGFLSVARHSIWVADRIADLGGNKRMQLQGLLHDAAEAYLGDLVRPLKHSPMGATYLEVESKLEAAIAARFQLEYPWPEYVHLADTYVLRSLEMGGNEYRWSWHGNPVEDAIAFVTEYNHLTGETL